MFSALNFDVPLIVKYFIGLGILVALFYLLSWYYDHISEHVEYDDLEMDTVVESSNSKDIVPILVEEIKRKYEDQNLRRETLENKISIIVALNGVIAAFVSASQDFIVCQKTILIGASALSSILGILGLWPKRYYQPNTLEYHLDLLDLNKELALTSLLNNYIASVEKNQEINDRRFEIFEDCLFFTTLSVFLLLIFTVLP